MQSQLIADTHCMKHDSSAFPSIDSDLLNRELTRQIMLTSVSAPLVYLFLVPVYLLLLAPPQSMLAPFLLWALLVIGFNVIRHRTVKRYIMAGNFSPRARRVCGVEAVISAIIWSAVVFLEYYFLPRTTMSWYAPVFIAGIAAGAVTSLSAVPWIARGFIIAILLPQIIAPLLAIHGFMGITESVAYFVFTLFMLQASARYSTLIEKNISGRIQKEQLLEEVERQKRVLEKHNEFLAESRQIAEQASRAKSDFLRMISHELRTPLNGILGMTDLALDEHDPEEIVSYLQSTRQSAADLLELINNLLDLSSIEAGKLPISSAPMAPKMGLEKWCAPLAVLAEGKKVLLSVDCANDLPKHVLTDATKFRQIVINLVGNAIKFTCAGQVVVSLECVQPQPQHAVLFLRVKDTGPGIPEAERERVFLPFEQIHCFQNSDITPADGTGLGLPIARSLARALGGDLMIEDSTPQGTTFLLTLPVEVIEREEEPMSLPAFTGALSQESYQATPVRVLVAEDNSVNQLVIMRSLERAGFFPTLAENGREAIELLEREAFDIVLMDCQMPEIDGIEATRRIRAREQRDGADSIPIIALTAQAFEEEKKQCIDVGMNAFLSKPFKRAELEALIRSFVTPESVESALS